MRPAPATTDLLRRMLHALLVFSIAATLAELLLLEHTENWIQLVPIATLTLGLLAASAALVLPRTATLHVMRWIMVAFVLAGIAGFYFHFRGNAEFELERRPALAGWELVRRTLQGATPALSPGVMIQLGLIGLLVTFRHPALSAREVLARPSQRAHPSDVSTDRRGR